MVRMLHKMGIRSNLMYSLGAASIGLAFASWATSLKTEHQGIDRADRWGIFVGEWAPTFFALGVALRIEETHPEPSVTREQLEETTTQRGVPSRAGV